jgi:hypothetical protein
LPNTAGGAAAAAAPQVGVGEDHVGRLAAQLQGDPLDGPGGPLHDAPPDLGRAGEGDLGHPGVLDQPPADHPTGPGEHVDHPVGDARLGGQLGEGQGGQRGQPGRLEDHRVAGGQGRGQLPGGDGEGEVPGHDQPHHPQRLAEGQVDPAGHRDGVAQQPLRRPGVVGEGVHHHAQLAPGVGDRLAGVAHLQLGQALALGVQPLGQPAQEPRPVGRGDRPPALERGRGPLDGGVGVGGGGGLQPIDHRPGGRVGHLEQGHRRSKPRNRSQSVTAASKASSSTVAMFV